MNQELEIPLEIVKAAWLSNVFQAYYYDISAGAEQVVTIDPVPDLWIVSNATGEPVVLSYGPFSAGQGVRLFKGEARLPGRGNTLTVRNIGASDAKVTVIAVSGFEKVMLGVQEG